MSNTLIQKQLFRGSHEYVVDDEQITVRAKTRLKEDVHSVTLAVLDPEPVITRTHLEFVSRVNGEPLLSLRLSKPNVAEFNAFVNIIKQRAQAEYNAVSGMNVAGRLSSYAPGNEQEPPEFSETSTQDIIQGKTVNVEGLENSINMLQTYVQNDEVQPLIAALDALRQSPQDRARLVDVATAFNDLESTQGAVLTYAPYISLMLSDDPFG